MNRRTVGAIGLSALAIAVAFPRADAQPSNDIVGTWTLVSTTNEKNGQKLFPYGPNAKGSFSLAVFPDCRAPVVRSSSPTTV